MSAYGFFAADGVVSRKPCKLLSVIVVTEGSGPGVVDIYNGVGPETGYKVARLYSGSNAAQQYRFMGLDLTRGLFVDIVEKAEYVTVEWEPALPEPA